MNPWESFVAAVTEEPAAPRVTFYERTPGPTQGERIELSGKVLLNWASKAANLLCEELDVEPGQVVSIVLPPAHWRTVYWLLAAWANGASVLFQDADSAHMPTHPAEADVRVGLEGRVDVLVTLPALARAATNTVPDGALDEARDLPTFGDQFVPSLPVESDEEALPGVTFTELGATAPAERAYLAAPEPQRLFAGVIGGGIMLVRGPVDEDSLIPLLQQEALRA